MASRSDLSNNWRVKSDLPARSSNIEAERSTQLPRYPRNQRDQPLNQSQGQPQDQQRYQQRDGINSRSTEPLQRKTNLMPRTVRGEDDPRTLQAIAEGRRVYVGNMPYMAKTEDVEILFADSDLVM